jgi:hypothetical protein
MMWLQQQALWMMWLQQQAIRRSTGSKGGFDFAAEKTNEASATTDDAATVRASSYEAAAAAANAAAANAANRE